MATQASAMNPATMAETAAPQLETTTLLDSVLDESIARDTARFDYAQRFSAAAAASKYFQDADSMPQALMKVMAGFELGLTPMASLTGINVIKGRVSMSGELIAAMLQKNGFSWKFGQHDANGCILYCYRDGQPITNQDGSHATVAFCRKDADAAGLTEKQGDKKDKPSMYDKYGMDMFFNRCIVRFQRRFAPGVTKGIPILTPDEAAEIYTPAPSVPQRKEVTTDAAV